jgi:hypothetical protein
MNFNKYNLPEEPKPSIDKWTESETVVRLSEALKIVGKENGISICQDDDGRPTLHFNPGLRKKDIESDRWNIGRNVEELFFDAVPDMMSLIASGKIRLPGCGSRKQAGPY